MQAVLEKSASPAGVGSLEALLNCNYPAGLIYHRAVTYDQDPMVRSDKLGWNTDEVSRQQLISGLDDALRQSSIFVHDPTTIQELLWFVINARGRAEGEARCCKQARSRSASKTATEAVSVKAWALME